MARDKAADPQPRGKSKNRWSLTSNITPTPLYTSTATTTPILPRPAPLLLLKHVALSNRVDLQLARNSYLFTYNTFIKILYMFRALPCSFSGGLRRNCIYATSGIVTVCR